MKPSTTALAAAVALLTGFPVLSYAQHGEGQHVEREGESMQGMPMKTESGAVSGTGVINSVDQEARSVNLSHQPIAAIGWPAMTMDMTVAEDVDLAAIEEGAPVTFTLKRGYDGIYTITGLNSNER